MIGTRLISNSDDPDDLYMLERALDREGIVEVRNKMVDAVEIITGRGRCDISFAEDEKTLPDALRADPKKTAGGRKGKKNPAN
jgi:hypothetical protein